MKKRYFIMTISLISIISLMSFTFSDNKQSQIHPIELVPDGAYGPWKTASCFRYLKYRIKKKSYQNEWGIQFKNNYNKSISMSVKIEDGYGGDRFTIESGATKTRSAYYTNNKSATYINFTVNKVKFDDTSWSGPYANCDH